MEVAPPMLPHRSHRAVWRAAQVVALVAVLAVTGRALLQTRQRLQQWHDDPDVASVWVVGITRGPDLTLTRGGPMLEWLNAHGVKIFGTADKVTSRYSGAPDGIEIWFAYHSHLRHTRELACHRVGRTAFTDDLGQCYHGLLDFEGDIVGVYLPAYDHAARRLTCTLHWMPRAPAPPTPISQPMRFEIELPRVSRRLPPAAQLSFGPVVQTRDDIRVTLGNARLSAPTYSGYDVRQRDLTFHLDIQGGVLAAANVDPHKSELAMPTATTAPMTLGSRRPGHPWSRPQQSQDPLTATDPYGVSLVPERGEVAPMMSLDELHCTRAADGVVWIVPVNGAGQGTDAVRVRFDVRPSAGGPLVPFDLTVRVRGDSEI